ncbi:serine hydrolase [Virgibacillus chiguensis]|uniref:D-alanyl-D-alanine carboxypeptidase n=1 Tax=Virgibacillus chiguensis TaxID=411959 RepID=A0A1M5XH93_9BACI|nr:serine hydrolase [Virgibacillus chiguensis]SHH99146.1 D-alanyl-D-alanine carboxypeptidase [Virgibacillus chiguensis]
MVVIILSLIVLVMVFISFLVGIKQYKQNLKNNEYDLLEYLEKHKDNLSITIKEDGHDTLTFNQNVKFPLASTVKIIIAFNFVRLVTTCKLSLSEKVSLSYIDKFYVVNTDGGAHPEWKKSIDNSSEVSLLDVAKGMMQFSSNACTDYLMNRIGLDVINESLRDLQINTHDKITYLTPSVLMPGYLSDKKKIATTKMETMRSASYQSLSEELFKKTEQGECEDLKEKTSRMLSRKIQYLITEKLPSSTTKDYVDLMYKLGKEILSDEEKKLFSEILIGENIKGNQDNYFWYKGGATPFVLTSSLYKENAEHSIVISLFMRDEKAEDSYWIQNVFNNFIFSIATDIDFKNKVKSIFKENM